MSKSGNNHEGIISKKKSLNGWVEDLAKFFEADGIYWCNGSQAEYDNFCQQLVDKGTFIKLNEQKHPNSFACFSDPSDVARVEDRTFICSRKKDDAGPTNNWMEPSEMKSKLNALMEGCMKGRTMYVIPFCMGPIGSPYSRYGIEITDSEYVVVNMKIMTRIGDQVMPYLDSNDYVNAYTRLELHWRKVKKMHYGLATKKNTSPISLKKDWSFPLEAAMAETHF